MVTVTATSVQKKGLSNSAISGIIIACIIGVPLLIILGGVLLTVIFGKKTPSAKLNTSQMAAALSDPSLVPMQFRR